MQIQDGSYPAKLTGAQVRLTTQQKLMIVFEWKLENGVTLRSYSVVSNQDGSLNPKPIEYIQRWCPEWDGTDPYWLEEHLPQIQDIGVRVSVRNEPDFRDSTKTVSKITWVNPVHWMGEAKAKGEGEEKPLEITDLKASTFDLNLIHPTMGECWAAFARMCEEAKVGNARRDALWIAEMASLIPGKDQINFTDEDWGRVLAWLRLANAYKLVG